MERFLLLVPASLIVLAGLYAGVGLFVWRRRPGIAFAPFVWMMASIAVRALGEGLAFLAPNLSGKVLAATIELVGTISAPVFLLFFCAAFTGRSHLLTTQNQAVAWLIPIGTFLLTFTNPYHHLIWERLQIASLGPLTYLHVEMGKWLRLQIAYTHVLLFISLGFLLVDLLRSSAEQRLRTALILIGTALPWIGGMIALVVATAGLDWLSFLFLPATAVMGWGILHYRLLDVFPMAPEMVLNDLQDGILVVDGQKRVLYLNKTVEKILGLSGETAFGQPIERLYPQCADTFARLLEQRETFIEKSFLLDGRETMFEIRLMSSQGLETGRGTPPSAYLVSFRNIHQRKQIEVDLERREALLGALNLAAQQFLKAAAWEANIPGFLEKLGQVTQASRAYVFQNYHGQDGLLYTSQTYEWTAPDIQPRLNNERFRHVPVKQIGLANWSEQLSQGKLIAVLTNELPLLEQTTLRERDVRAALIAPIFVEGKWWGFIGLEDHVNDRVWRKSELESLQAAADIFSAAEARARSEFALRRRQRTLNLLHGVVLTALQADDLQAMSDALTSRLSELANANACFLFMWDKSTQLVRPLAGHGDSREVFLAIEPEQGEISLAASTLQAGHALIIDDVAHTTHLSPRILEQFPYRAIMSFPLIARQKWLGAIILAYNHPRRFQPEEISIGEQAASLIALALEKFQAVEAASKRAEESETLRRAGAAVVQTLRSTEAVDRILEQLSLVVPYDSASVQLLRENELEIVGGRGWDEEAMKKVMGLRFPVPGDNPNSVVIETGKPYILNNPREVHETFAQEPHSHIRSWMGIPLAVRGQVIGLLAIDSMHLNRFTDEDVKMAVAFADQVAIALENARLYEEAQNMALTDALTGLYNRRGLFEIGRLEFSRARRNKRPFSALMIDIDYFKRVNDLHGHAIGDQALQGLAMHLNRITRDIDIVGRYGGEEFVVLLSDTPLDAAQEIAERLRATVEKSSLPTDSGHLRVTISVGVAASSPETPDLETLIARADQALYKAKHRGRNRVEAGR
ncbi:MAG: histidine kinase N-terminal 7TM domain-containing protein [Anaerolineales bacterium]